MSRAAAAVVFGRVAREHGVSGSASDVKGLPKAASKIAACRTRANKNKQLEQVETEIAAVTHRLQNIRQAVRAKRQRDRKMTTTARRLLRLASDPKVFVLHRLRELSRRAGGVKDDKVRGLPPFTARAMLVASCQRARKPFDKLSEGDKRRLEEGAGHNKQLLAQVAEVLATGSTRLSAEVDDIIANFTWRIDL